MRYPEKSWKKGLFLALVAVGLLSGNLYRKGFWDENQINVYASAAKSVADVRFDPKAGLADHAMHIAVWPLAIVNFYPPFLPFYESKKSRQAPLRNGSAILSDLGAEKISFQTDDGVTLDGVYLSAEKYFQNREAAFQKWRAIFSQREEAVSHAFYEIQDDGENFEALFGLPAEVLKREEKGSIKGVVYCFGVGNLYEWNIAAATMYLARGKDVLFFNYRGHGKSEKVLPGWEGTSLDGKAAVNELKRRLNCDYSNLLVHGYSLGSGPAVYSGVACPGLNVLIDRGFSRLSFVASQRISRFATLFKPILVNSVERFYRYPNEDWIGLIKGRVLIVEGINDTYIISENAKKLFKALAIARLGENPEEDALTALEKEHWIKVKGGHTSQKNHNGESAWPADSKAQQLLTEFLEKSES